MNKILQFKYQEVIDMLLQAAEKRGEAVEYMEETFGVGLTVGTAVKIKDDESIFLFLED